MIVESGAYHVYSSAAWVVYLNQLVLQHSNIKKGYIVVFLVHPTINRDSVLIRRQQQHAFNE